MIADLLDDDRHIEGGIETGGRVKGFFEQGVDFPGLAIEGIAGFLEGCHDAVVVGQIAHQPDRRAQRRNFVGDGQIGNPGGPVNLRTAQVFRRDIFAENRLDDSRPGQTEEGVAGLNQEAALAGQIAAAPGIETEHAHDAGDDSADLAQGGKGLGIAVKTADPGRDKRPGTVVHADQGNPFFAGHLEQTGQLAAIGGIHGTGPHGKIVPVEGHVTAADVQNARNQRSPIEVLAPVLEQDIGFLIGENLDSFPDGHALFEVLFFNLRDAHRLDGALRQLVADVHRLFITARLAGDLTRDGEFDFLGWRERIFQ